MKKIVIVLVLLILVSSLAFATDDFYKCSQLIDKKLKDSTVLMIQRYSGNLTEMEKYTLYETNKTNGTVPFVLNLVLGCGIGSFVQGDTAGGLAYLALELIDYFGYLGAYGRALNATTQAQYDAAVTSMGTWTIALVVARVCECVRPFIYSNRYNKRLSNAIYGSETRFAFDPVVFDDGNVGMRLSAKISY